jgi:glucose-specific phosphotransferase system IIA component
VADARDTDSLMELVAPLDGWVLPLAEVPDPVFAAAMAGDGVAIDPTGESLHAPCDGVVVLMGGARHALTLRSRAGDILLHVGIDTVRLAGAGFQRRVRDGETVRGDARFYADDPFGNRLELLAAARASITTDR